MNNTTANTEQKYLLYAEIVYENKIRTTNYK